MVGRKDLDCFSGTATAYAEMYMQVCPAGTRLLCQLVRLPQLKGSLKGLRLLAWSNVINPFSSHVSGREGVLLEDDAGASSGFWDETRQ